MRWIKFALDTFVKIALTAFFALVLVPVGLFIGFWAVADRVAYARANSFYERHMLLNEMKNATESINRGQIDPIAVRKSVLLKRMPLGTSKSEVNQTLAAEGFACQRWQSSRSRHAVDCFLSGAPDYIVRWLIQLDYDDAEKLTNANVWILKSPDPSY